jgi:hypothetical protein
MPINKQKKKSVTINLLSEQYNEFHNEAQRLDRSDSYLALKVFLIGWEIYKKQLNEKKEIN